MILIAFLILILYIIEIIFEAGWDAEAFKEGKSKHVFKIVFVSAFLLIPFILKLIDLSLLKLAILILIYPFVREMLFDYSLNHFRNLKHDYKIRKNIYKWLDGAIVIGLLTLLHIL